MKKDKNVTDSVTPDIADIADNLKELSKNTQKEVKPDIYASKLPVIIEELRFKDKQVVEEKDWYKYTALTCVPFAGAVYMMLQGDEQNINKRNFCLAAFKSNLVYSAAFIVLCVILIFAGNSAGRAKVNNKAGKEIDAVTDEEQITQASGSIKTSDLDNSKNYAYDSASKSFEFRLDDVSMTYPVTVKQLKADGYTYMSQASQPHSQALMTSYANSKTGTKVALTITLSDTSQDDMKCSEMQVKFADKTEFLGLTKGSDVEKVKSTFADADKEDITDYSESTKTGSIVYSFGTIKISVSIKNGTVSSVTIR